MTPTPAGGQPAQRPRLRPDRGITPPPLRGSICGRLWAGGRPSRPATATEALGADQCFQSRSWRPEASPWSGRSRPPPLAACGWHPREGGRGGYRGAPVASPPSSAVSAVRRFPSRGGRRSLPSAYCDAPLEAGAALPSAWCPRPRGAACNIDGRVVALPFISGEPSPAPLCFALQLAPVNYASPPAANRAGAL